MILTDDQESMEQKFISVELMLERAKRQALVGNRGAFLESINSIRSQLDLIDQLVAELQNKIKKH